MKVKQEQHKNYKLLGLNIAYYRKERGLSQMQLAERINISRTHMSRIETADCAVSLDVIFDICDALNVNPSKLFDFRKD
ncbi:MAG: helix-turn-helix transcriptional regulator [Ruminococcus sp.]|nr:helix-turn-helix transcriptional regulator [Ruminococcus sp.]